ncbi:MAG: uracil-DNA glycosylase, partial [Elusimicrobiota bacterium]|nr:uracil-DNA glycosylase [Elusimicrobiota bacterium]
MKNFELKKILKDIIDIELEENGFTIMMDSEAKNSLIDFSLDLKNKNIIDLKKFEKKYRDCKNCDLCKTRKNIVLGGNNIEAKIFFIAECPWKEDDLSGQVFSGEKGGLFDKILQSINLDRDKIFITDIVKCIPLDDNGERRKPSSNEIDICS